MYKERVEINDKKAAQIASFFLGKTKDGRMPYLKLIKLMYLAERESILRWGFPMLGDNLVSMPHGPVLSTVLNFIKGERKSPRWNESIRTDKNRYEVFSVENADTDELSRAEIELLEEIWRKFGKMDKWGLKDWTHSNCREWKDPNGSSIPITHEDILKAGGFDDDKAREISEEIESFKRIDEIFASL